MAFGYYSPLSINAAQVPTTQTDFPVLVNVTDARFKDIAHSGHVQSSSGFDIRPYTNSTLSTAITGYELERYNASTGEVIMWVKVSSLSSSTTPFVLAYGDSGITTDGSSTTTWSNSFLGVYHLANGTVLSVNSSTGSNNGTGHGTVGVPTATSGQIDGASAHDSVDHQYIDLGTGITPTAITQSAWVNGNFLNSYNAVIDANLTDTKFAALLVKSTGKLAPFVTGTGTVGYDGTGSHTLSTSTWYLLHLTYDSSAGLVAYVNAASDGSAAANGNLNISGASMFIGADQADGRYWDGKIDEARIASVARSQDWITTEYNNQFAPGTFETLGAEVSVNPVMGLYVFSSFFKSPLTADHLQVPSDQTDFPILIDKTDNRFKTVANGGHVQNANGYDIRPYSDSGLTTPLTYELDYYNASTGQVVMWVKWSTLSSSVDTVTYFRYGDSSITTDGSSASTWSNNFLYVYHLKDGSALSVLDSLGTTGVNHGATATTGQIDGGAAFVSASSQYIDSGNSVAFAIATTASAWVNATSFPNAFNSVVIKDQSSVNEYIRLSVTSAGKLTCEIKATADVSYSGTGTNTLSAGTWYYLTETYSAAAGLIGYVNAGVDKTVAANGDISGGGAANFLIGDNQRFAGTFWNGKIDEARLASVARSADWITVEYNNQKPSSTFITLGAES